VAAPLRGPTDHVFKKVFFHSFDISTMLDFLKNIFTSGPSADFKAMMEAGALIVDVRTPGEFSQGHIKGSVNIPLDQIGKKIATLKGKNVPIITVCRSGGRSSAAAGLLKNSGVDVYNGGAWDSLEAQLA
jgi:rhodanese-related sulfurtransferase